MKKKCYKLKTWSRRYKLFSSSAQLRLKFILLINVKMPTVIGILTFMSRINYRLELYTFNFNIYGLFIIYNK